MIIAGAGGHALELLDILISKGMTENLFFYDEINSFTMLQGKYPVYNTLAAVEAHFQEDPRFILGTGNPQVRKDFYDRFTSLGGELCRVKGDGATYSNFAAAEQADVFNLSFIGANTSIAKGCLINTGAQIHHEVSIGAFSEVNPGAVVLGKVEIGELCSIGANATILPKIKVGNRAIIGAGSVVTQDVPAGATVVGVPARMR